MEPSATAAEAESKGNASSGSTAFGLLDLAPDPVLAVDAGGRIAYVNPLAAQLFGATRPELVGETVEAVIPVGLTENGHAGTNGAGPLRAARGLELRGLRRDGTEVPIEASFVLVDTRIGTLSVGIIRDLTSRNRVESELKVIRDRLSEAQRLARLGSWEWDIVANRVYWSDEMFRIYGLEPGAFEPSYERYLSLQHPDDRDGVEERIRSAVERRRPFDSVSRALRPDGSEFLLRSQGEVDTDDAGHPIRMRGICEDVTAEKRAEEATARLASIVQTSEDAIVTRSLEGEITSWNPGAARLYGYTAEEALGKGMDMLVPETLLDEAHDRFAQIMAGERVGHFETQRLRKDGTTIDVSLTMSPVVDSDDRLIGVSAIARDITERKRLEERLTELANFDPLTNLFNRHRFEDELVTQVLRARRYQTTGAVFVLDIDNFKYVNDTYGHGAGDEVLQRVARLLEGRLRRTDILARLGGDEFAVLVPEADEEHTRQLAGDLLEAIRQQTLQIDGHPLRITSSIGVTMLDDTMHSPAELLAEADRAMYDAKDAGRDRAVVLGPEDRGNGKREGALSWEHRIRQALAEDRFVLYSQPILDLKTDEISQYELLLRMETREKPILPGAFLGVAERLGLIHEIDRWVVTQAIRMLAENDGLRLEVNLSGRSVDDESILNLIRGELGDTGVDPARLIFEITETAAIASLDEARRFAQALAELGCSFALDDFGAGFGSFYYLKHIPASYLKIDGDFVRSPRSRTDELVVESMVHMARGLQKRTIAEFVEDARTLEVIRAGGVDFAQGFHIGAPAPLH
jgi:diguanylate cyclase (GGDEF)-like protein/PAS domain S-box-containing protein